MDPALQELKEGNGDDSLEVLVKLANINSIPNELHIVTRFEDIATARIKRKDILNVWSDNRVVSLKAPRLVQSTLHHNDEQDPSYANFNNRNTKCQLGKVLS